MHTIYIYVCANVYVVAMGTHVHVAVYTLNTLRVFIAACMVYIRLVNFRQMCTVRLYNGHREY